LIMSQESYELKVYPLAEEEFIGMVNVQETPVSDQDASLVETVIILDRSGSMGDAARRVTNEIIPLFLSKLSYDEKQVIHFITFDSVSELYSKRIEELKSLAIKARDGTVMAPVISKCQQLLETFDQRKPIRLLIVSDGEVSDIEETQSASSAFVEFLKNHDFSINSQAIRLFTSTSQPDTTALASFLQINNTTTSRLVDISPSDTNDAIADKVADLFRSDNLANGRVLISKDKIFIKYPWESKTTDRLTLTPGDNLFWLNADPKGEISIGEHPVKMEMQQPITLHQFQDLMKEKLDNIVDQMRILKVVGTEETEETVAKMFEYFSETEKDLMMKSSSQNVQHSKVTEILEVVANDEMVKTLCSKQKAEYLRQNNEPIAEQQQSPPRDETDEQIYECLQTLTEELNVMQVKLENIKEESAEQVEHFSLVDEVGIADIGSDEEESLGKEELKEKLENIKEEPKQVQNLLPADEIENADIDSASGSADTGEERDKPTLLERMEQSLRLGVVIEKSSNKKVFWSAIAIPLIAMFIFKMSHH
jgi:hypothetical protein